LKHLELLRWPPPVKRTHAPRENKLAIFSYLGWCSRPTRNQTPQEAAHHSVSERHISHATRSTVPVTSPNSPQPGQHTLTHLLRIRHSTPHNIAQPPPHYTPARQSCIRARSMPNDLAHSTHRLRLTRCSVPSSCGKRHDNNQQRKLCEGNTPPAAKCYMRTPEAERVEGGCCSICKHAHRRKLPCAQARCETSGCC
jgi:hypothetical protein